MINQYISRSWTRVSDSYILTKTNDFGSSRVYMTTQSTSIYEINCIFHLGTIYLNHRAIHIPQYYTHTHTHTQYYTHTHSIYKSSNSDGFRVGVPLLALMRK
jgi:hypothetical protein